MSSIVVFTSEQAVVVPKHHNDKYTHVQSDTNTKNKINILLKLDNIPFFKFIAVILTSMNYEQTQ